MAGLIALWLLAMPVAGQAPPVSEAARRALLALEQEWNAAVVKKDMAALERILAPGFTFIDVDGTQTSRAEVLDGIRSPRLVIAPFESHEVQVRVYGRTAVLTGWFEQNGSFDGRKFSLRKRFTEVYAFEGGRWVAVSGHASPLRRIALPPAARP